MKTCTEQDYFDALIRKYAPFAHSCPTRAQVEEWRGRLPDFLLRWWSEQGWGSLSKGQYWVCNPDLLRPVMEEVFNGDPDYNIDSLIPFGYNALGMIDLFMGEGRTMTVDLMFGTVIWRDHPYLDHRGRNPYFKPVYFRINGGAHRLDWNDEDGNVEIPVVVTIAQPFEEETVARPIAPGIVYMAAFHVGKQLMKGIRPLGEDAIAGGTGLDPLRLGDLGASGIRAKGDKNAEIFCRLGDDVDRQPVEPARIGNEKASRVISTGFGFPHKHRFPNKMDNPLSLMEDLSGTCHG